MKISKVRSRRAAIIEALLEYMIYILVTGAFLATILKRVGVSDAVTGVVSSFISLACLTQLFSGIIVRRRSSIKKTILILTMINEVMFASLYLIPFFSVPQWLKVTLFVVMILSAYLIMNIYMPVKYKWVLLFMVKNGRGRFTANKEIISLIFGMIFSLGMGRLVDHFKEAGDERTGFILCGVTIFIVAILHITTLVMCDDEKDTSTYASKGNQLAASVKMIGESKRLRKLLVLDILWHTAYYIAVPYYGTYLIGELGFSLTDVSLMTIVYSVVRALVSRPFGKIADRKGFAHLMTLCMVIFSAGMFLNVFTSPALRWLYVAYYVLVAVSEAGINGGLYNITFDYIDSAHFARALGARNAVGGLVGFLASLLGGVILSAVQKNGGIFGIPVYAQQVNSAISLMIVILLLVYMKNVVAKLPRVEYRAIAYINK